jgi:hypothetical protein
MSTNFTPLDLESYTAGDCSADLARRIEADAQAMAQVVALRQANEEFLFRHPSSRVVAQISERARPAWQNWLSHLHRPMALGLAGVFSVALVVVTISILLPLYGPTAPGQGDTWDVVRSKGAEQGIRLFHNTGNTVQALDDGATIAAYNTLQIALHPGEHAFGLAFSIDGRASLTLHYPPRFTESPTLAPGRITLLPYAYQLDDAPYYEHFYFVTSPGAFELQALWSSLESQVRALAAPPGDPPKLEFPPSFKVYSFTIIKAGGGPQ